MTVPLAVPTLQGSLVQLRPHRESDLEAVLERSLDPETARWTTIPLGYTRAMADDYLTSLLEPSPERASWAIEVEGRYAGTIDLRAMPVDGGAGDLGFVTHPAFRGRGVMSEGVGLVVERALDVWMSTLRREASREPGVTWDEAVAALTAACGGASHE